MLDLPLPEGDRFGAARGNTGGGDGARWIESMVSARMDRINGERTAEAE
jgi:hypothetical protein